MQRKFKAGDKVLAHGLHGVVTYIDPDPSEDYPVNVNLEVIGKEKFTLDGRAHITYKNPELKLVRPMVPKKKTLFIAITTEVDYGSRRGAHQTSHAYPNKSDLDEMFSRPYQLVEVEIEVEE